MVAIEPEERDVGFVLQSMRHAIDKLELEFARFAAEFTQGAQWDREGFDSPSEWMRFNCHMTSNAAWKAVKVGEQMEKLPQSLEALSSGDIGYAHLATIANTADKVKGFQESELLPLAREHTPGKFHYKVEHYRHARDRKSYEREQEGLFESRCLRLNTAQDGCLLISGVLDPVGGAAVRGALEPLARPMGEHDHRTREQRLADAAVEFVTAGKPATVQVTATVETLRALAGAAGGEMEFSLPLPSATVQRLACDSSVMRVLFEADSLPIDVGRSRRLVDGGLRKALAVRDKHCQWPGCERPASWCDGHHLVHWVDGGETNLENTVLLCKRHHRMVHEGGWKLIKVEGKIVSIAPTVTFGLPRGPD
jgi:hypothetical protein